jgi:hypothetical protein
MSAAFSVAIGYCLIPVVVAWGLTYGVIRGFVGTKLTPFQLTFSLIVTHIASSFYVSRTTQSTSLLTPFVASILITASIYVALINLKRKPTEDL